MEETKDHNHGSSCNCGMCRCGSWGYKYLLRWILALVILGMVFHVGVKVGEFKAEFLGGAHYGNRMFFHKMMMDNASTTKVFEY